VKLRNLSLTVLFLSLAMSLTAQAIGDRPDDDHVGFRVMSTEFRDNSTLPISVINNITIPAGFPNAGSNACSINGAPGGNESPELSWTDVPRGTRSFAVVMFDETASFMHWGMYNISADVTELPQNAGVVGSTFGQQIPNDSFNGAEYYGPCPPSNFPPNVHHYVFTVYALDKELTLPSSTNFPAFSETLFQALLEAGEQGHILASAKIVGLYSTTPPGN
jgi:Raf kinase inhibitor-like YbhB/YbcL family protein